MAKQQSKGAKKGNKPAVASHDTQPPQALIDFMMTGWKELPRKPAQKVPGLERFQARRKKLSALFPRDALVIPTGHEKIRSNDTGHPFRPGSDFYYLTGNKEADCVLVMLPKRSNGHESILFVEPEVDRSTPAFFTDRARGALWVGPRLGLAGSKVRYGVDRTMALTELAGFLDGLKNPRVRRGLSAAVDALVPASPKDQELAAALAELRMIKDAEEVASIKNAIRATKSALEDSLRAMKHAHNERELMAAFDYRAVLDGNGVSFGSIVASGAHACILHWTRNDGKIERDKLLMMDVGVESDDLYAADITRTFPANGKFSREQRELYDLVTAAQDAAFKAIKPGADFTAPHDAAHRVLAAGFQRLGIIKESPEEALRPDRLLTKRYTLHNVSHLLGIDVHDSADARVEKYRKGKLVPGMVLTVEPGVYFQLEDETVPARYRGIGIRVEEDVLVTKTGCQVLSKGIPRKSDEIEAWIAQLWK